MHRIILFATMIAFGTASHDHRDAGPRTDHRRCSLRPPPPTDGYDPASMAKYASVVLRVRADSTSPSVGRPPFLPQSLVFFTVLEVIDSGSVAVPTSLAFDGRLTDKPDFNTGTVPYRWVRPDGLSGACFAYSYQRGGEFLLLLTGSTLKALTPYWAALQPTNDQVRGATDPWIAWVRETRRAGRGKSSRDA